MYSKINYTIVGLFVTLFTVALFAFGFWLAKYSNSNEYKLYKIYFSENVSGLNVDSSVKLKGVEIGKVASIKIDPKNINRVEVIVKIQKDVPIKEDMVAYLEPIGITGLLSIIIDGGSNSSKPLLAKDGTIPVIKSRPSWLVNTKNSVANIAKNLNETLLRFNQLLDKNNIQNISETITNIKDLSSHTKKLEKALEDLVRNSNNTIITLNRKVQDLNVTLFNTLAKESYSDLVLLRKHTLPLLKSLQKSSDRFRAVVNRVDKGLKRGNYNLKAIFEPMTIDLRVLTNSVNSLVREIEQSPSDLIFKSRKTIKGPGE